MKTKLTHHQRNAGNFLIIIGGFVIVPLIGIGIGAAIGYLIFTEIRVPNPPPAPMIDWEDSPMLTPMCDCGGICVVNPED